MSSGSRLQLHTEDQVLSARITGEMEFSGIQELRAEIVSRLTDADLSLILDLRAVTFLDSSGIQLLFDLQRLLEQRRARCAVLVDADATITRALALADPTHMLGLVHTDEHAHAAVRA